MPELKNFSISFGSKPVFENISFSFKENFSVIGPNGSGKSTLALALASVIPDFVEAKTSGFLHCDPCGLVMQNPSTQFFAMTVKEELGPKGLSLAKKLGLQFLFERSVFQLSEGEKQMINLVSNLSFNSKVLLFDEPLELLDPVEAACFKKLLLGIRAKKVVWFDKIDPNLSNFKKFFLGNPKKLSLPLKKKNVVGKRVLNAEISLQRNDFSLNGNLSLYDGEKIALIGRNGCGKSSFLKLIAGFEKFSGDLEVNAELSFSPQNPSHLFFNETAEAELVDLKNAKTLGIQSLLKQNPNNLSKGQQKLLSVASIKSKGVALLDEPTTWLDLENKAKVYSFLNESNQPMIIATHDPNVLSYCDKTFLIEGGELKQCSSTVANRFFRQ